MRAKGNMNVATAVNATYFVQDEAAKKTLRLPSHIRVSGKSSRLLGNEAFRIAFSTLIIIGAIVGSVFYFQNLNTAAFSPTTTTAPSSSFSATTNSTSSPPIVKIPSSPTLVVQASNHSVMYRTFNVTTGWNGWVGLPGQNTADSPAAVLVGNELHVVVRGQGGDTLWYGYVNGTGDFSNWTQISGSTPSAPTLTSNGTALCLVARSEENCAEYCFYDLVSQKWNSWAIIPNKTTCDSPAATIYAGQLHMVVRDIDSDKGEANASIWHSYVDLSTGNFSGWRRVYGLTQSAPTLAASELLNRVFLVVRDLEGQISINTWNGSNWKGEQDGWVAIEDRSTGVGPGASVIGDELLIVMPDSGGVGLWQVRVFWATNWPNEMHQIDTDLEELSKPTLTG
jgi:hypothetical protein